jgi:hypothetical protein
MFEIILVDPDRRDKTLETLGTKRKYWFRDSRGCQMLFKAEERGTGEDWAEKIACELAELLGLPHVHYELAEEKKSGTPGVVCENCAPPPLELILGNQLLLDYDPNYPKAERRKYKVRQHTVDAVADAVSQYDLPPQNFIKNLPAQVKTALDVYIGYVMLDALIANQDRHHENWAAIRDDKGRLLLAPTFDHGASLARNITDKERYERMTTRDANRQLSQFVRRAKSAFYGQVTDPKPLLTFEAWRAFAKKNLDAASAWLERLRSISENDIRELLAKIPGKRMSDICRQFTQQLLNENRRRLLEEGINE